MYSCAEGYNGFSTQVTQVFLIKSDIDIFFVIFDISLTGRIRTGSMDVPLLAEVRRKVSPGKSLPARQHVSHDLRREHSADHGGVISVIQR